MRTLITGAGGFIGSHLADSLIQRGYEVTGLDRTFKRNPNAEKLERVVDDLTTTEALDRIIARSDVIIHLAAVSRVDEGQRQPQKCLEVNVGGITRILEALKKQTDKVIILGSSREVYGEPRVLPVQESDPKDPISIYGISKLTAEMLLHLYSRLFGIRFVILRFSNVYGSTRDLPERVVPKFARLASQGLPLTVYGGKQTLDFTFIDDVVEGVTELVNRILIKDESCINEQYHLTSCKGTSILQLAQNVNEIFESKAGLEIKEGRGQFDVQNFVGDYTKAHTDFSYEPKHSLEKGLRKYKERLKDIH